MCTNMNWTVPLMSISCTSSTSEWDISSTYYQSTLKLYTILYIHLSSVCNWTIKTPLNCVSITMLLSVSFSVRCSVMEYIFVFDSTLCTIWVMSCLDESGITLYLWSTILYQFQDYIGWKCTYQTTRETIVLGDSYIQGNNSCVVV